MPRRKHERPSALVYNYRRKRSEKLPRGVFLGKFKRSTGLKTVWREVTLDKATAKKYGMFEGPDPLTKNQAEQVLEKIIAEDMAKPLDTPSIVEWARGMAATGETWTLAHVNYIADYLAGWNGKPGNATTLESFATRWLASKLPTWAPKTRTATKNLVERHIIEPLGAQEIRNITLFTLQEHVNSYMERKAGKSLVSKIVGNLRAILNDAVFEDIITKNPAVKLQYRCPRVETNAHSPEECKRLYLAAVEPREHLILRIAIELGFRSEEIFALRANDVLPSGLRVDEAFVAGQIGEPKTKSSNRVAYLTPSLEAELRDWTRVMGQDDWLFPSDRAAYTVKAAAVKACPARTGHKWKVDGREQDVCARCGATRAVSVIRSPLPLDPGKYLKDVLKPLAERAGVPEVTFQSLRRSYGTGVGRFCANQRDLQQLMGHSDPTTALKYYQKPVSEEMQRAQLAWSEMLTVKDGGVQ